MNLRARLGGITSSEDVSTRWQVIILLGVFVVLGIQAVVVKPASPSQPLTGAPWIDFQNGTLSVEIKNGSWLKVLNEVRAKTGMFLHVSIPLEGSVTASFKDLPVEQAVKRLFGPDVNFVFLYGGRNASGASMPVPSDVWVLGKSSGEAAKTSQMPDGKQEGAASAGGDPENSIQEITREFDRNPLAAWDAAMGSRNEEVRLKAIAYLGQQPNREAVDVLMKVAALDPDAQPHIRQSALDALQGLVHDHSQVQEILTQVLETQGPWDMQKLAADMLGVPLAPVEDGPASGDSVDNADSRGPK